MTKPFIYFECFSFSSEGLIIDISAECRSNNAGLAAYIFSTNAQRTWRVAEALECGIVGINEGLVSSEVFVCIRKIFIYLFEVKNVYQSLNLYLSL